MTPGAEAGTAVRTADRLPARAPYRRGLIVPSSNVVADNKAVGRLDPAQLPALADRLDINGADAVVLSACVQMPSLAAVPVVEERLGLPVFTAAIATARRLLDALGLEPRIPGAGALLA